MTDITKDNTLVITNSSGGQAVLAVTARFSSRIFFEQVCENGLDLADREFIYTNDLDNYEVDVVEESPQEVCLQVV